MTMSVKKAKERCGYDAKPAFKTCGTCGAFASSFEYPEWCKGDVQRSYYDLRGYAKVEKNLRCADHGFATKKGATCRLWRARGSS